MTELFQLFIALNGLPYAMVVITLFNFYCDFLTFCNFSRSVKCLRILTKTARQNNSKIRKKIFSSETYCYDHQLRMAKTVKTVLYVVGGTIYFLGFLLIFIWRPVFYYFVAKNVALTNGSLTEQTWIKNAVPIDFKVYMFNWSNPEKTLAKKEDANFVEMGPYTFRFTEFKSNTTWNENGTLTFSSNRDWTFVPEQSNGRLSDRVTNINTLAMSIGDRAKNLNWVEKDLVSEVLHLFGENVYVTKTVEELLFEGYDDRMLEIANFLQSIVHIDIGYLPEKFGWYFKKNMTEIDVFNIHTGIDDINLLGKVHSWNYADRCGVYFDECDQVRGSLGDIWPMNIANENIASIFISDFCGAFDLTKEGRKILNHVGGVRFVGTEQTFDNGTKYAENRCYCKNDSCKKRPSGVRDVSDCVHGPIYVSFPHFYLADEKYRQNLSGMSPTVEQHQFSVTLQEDSGIVMEIFARLQINVDVVPYPGISFFSNLPKIMFPTVWFEEHAELPNDLRTELELLFTKVQDWLPAFAYVLMITGGLIGFTGFLISQSHRSSNFQSNEGTDSSIPYTKVEDEEPVASTH